MKTIAPNNLIVYVVVALLKGVKHLGMPSLLKNVEVAIDGESAEYKELYAIEAINSPEMDYDYLEDVASYLNEQTEEQVLKVYSDFIAIRKEYKGEYIFLHEEKEYGVYFCRCKTVSRGMTITE